MAVFNLFGVPTIATDDADLTISTSTHIQIASSSSTLNFYGTGFVVDPEDGLTDGILTGMDYGTGGSLSFEFLGLNHDAPTALVYAAFGGNWLMEFLLSGNDTINGSALDESLQGFAGSDVVNGGAGNDTLRGTFGSGMDTLSGGTGNDVYQFANGSQHVVVELPGEGTDHVFASTSFQLPENFENLSVDSFGSGTFARGNTAANRIVAGYGNDLVEGLGGDDTLEGGYGDDTLSGGEGNDAVDAGEGNDTIIVSAGADAVQGGTGNDLYILEAAPGSLADESGLDTIRSHVNFTLPAFAENLEMLGAALSGTGNGLDNRITANNLGVTIDADAGNDTLIGGLASDVLSGGAGNDDVQGGGGADAIYGGTGNDTLDGGVGADVLAGGEGDDHYMVDNAGDQVQEAANGGIDTVSNSVSGIVPDGVEHWIIVGQTVVAVTGNALNNDLSANGLANIINGGAGADTMRGWGGGDTYYVDHAGDQVIEPSYAENNTDTIYSSVSFDLANAPTIEVLTLTGTAHIDATGAAERYAVITGNSGNNHLTAVGGDDLYGMGGNDILDGAFNHSNLLDGGTGADTLKGGGSADVYVVDNAGDVVLEPDNVPGRDFTHDSVTSSASYALPVRVETLTLTGSGNIDASSVHGGKLVGNGGANALTGGREMLGGAGNDTLTGNAASELLRGGTGDDTYVVWSADTELTEYSGEGYDSLVVNGVAAYALPTHIEKLTLADGASVSAYGNSADNLLVGNSGNNTLYGGDGDDTLQGGAGNDYYVVEGLNDVVIELAAGGTDTVEVSVSGGRFSLVGTAVENLLLAPEGQYISYAYMGIGNELDNRIRGNWSTNYIDGGAGADEMIGLAGDDIYVVDNVGDVVVEVHDAFFHDDMVRSSLPSYTLAAEVENLALIGAAANGTGNSLDNWLYGNPGTNRLEGGAGADRLMGHAGNDTLVGGTGNDFFEGDAGLDTVVYEGLRADYEITKYVDSVRVSFGSDGEWDELRSVDLIVFDDETVVINEHVATGTVTLTGTATEGHVLTASTSGIVDADGVGGLFYEWFRDEEKINYALASASTYTLTASDVGKQISLRVGFRDGDGNIEQLWSAPTAAIALGDHEPPFISAISPQDGATGVAPTTNITITYTEAVKRGFGTITLHLADGAVESFNAATSDRVQLVGNTLTIDPTQNLVPGTTYYVWMDGSAIEDMAGNDSWGLQGYDFVAGPYRVEGTDEGELLAGQAVAEVIEASGGDDRITGGGGKDTIHGGDGFDTLIVPSSVSAVSAPSKVGDLWQMTTPAGIVAFDGIERVELTNAVLAFDTHPGESAWEAAALYWLLAGSAPPAAFLGLWTAEADEQPTLASLAQALLDYYVPGVPTYALFMHVYNVLAHAQPSDADVAFVSSLVGPGLVFENNGELLAYIAEMPVNTDRMVDFVGSVQTLGASWFA